MKKFVNFVFVAGIFFDASSDIPDVSPIVPQPIYPQPVPAPIYPDPWNKWEFLDAAEDILQESEESLDTSLPNLSKDFSENFTGPAETPTESEDVDKEDPTDFFAEHKY